jgi:hypothetical protein
MRNQSLPISFLNCHQFFIYLPDNDEEKEEHLKEKKKVNSGREEKKSLLFNDDFLHNIKCLQYFYFISFCLYFPLVLHLS